MNLKTRLEALEQKATEIAKHSDGAVDRFREELTAIADRVRGLELDEVLRNPAPVTALAMFYDGRVNERLVELITEYAQRPELVGALFKRVLEMIDAA